MAFTSITSGQIQTGKPVTNTVLTTIKDDLDDLNSRVTSVEGTVNAYAPVIFEIPGPGKIEDGAAYWRVPFNINIDGVRVAVIKAGASGTLTVDVEKKHGVGAFSSILSSTITAAYSSGDLYVASGTLSVSTASAGDWIRVNLDTLQTGMGDVQVIFEFSKA